MAILVNGINPTMFPTPSSLLLRTVDLNTVKEILKSGFISAIGHQSTADLLTTLLGIKVEMNRTIVKADYGETLIVFTLKSRIPEGKVLSQTEIESIGYEFYAVIVWNEEWNKFV